MPVVVAEPAVTGLDQQQRRRAGDDLDRRGQTGQHDRVAGRVPDPLVAGRHARLDAVRPGGQAGGRTVALGDDVHLRRRAEVDGLPAVHHRHPLGEAQRRLVDRRPRVVVGQDLPVRPAVRRVAVGAPLGQPDAVAPAVADQRIGGRSLRGNGSDERRRGHGEQDHQTSCRRPHLPNRTASRGLREADSSHRSNSRGPQLQRFGPAVDNLRQSCAPWTASPPRSARLSSSC